MHDPFMVSGFWSGAVRVFLVLFVLIGALTVFFGWRAVARGKASVGWPHVNGTVTRSTVDMSPEYSTAEVGFQYSVAGTTYSGNRIQFGYSGSEHSSEAKEIWDRFRLGNAVPVYYDPQDPAISVLVPGSPADPWFVPELGAVFIIVGCLVFLAFTKSLRQQRALGEKVSFERRS